MRLYAHVSDLLFDFPSTMTSKNGIKSMDISREISIRRVFCVPIPFWCSWRPWPQKLEAACKISALYPNYQDQTQSVHNLVTQRLPLPPFINMVTQKRWDCKDDLKLFKFDDSEFRIILLPWIYFYGLFNDKTKKETSLYVRKQTV